MRRLAAALVSATLFTAIAWGDDVDELQGTWKLTRALAFGKEYPNHSETLIIKGHEATRTAKYIRNGSITLGLPQEPRVFEKVLTSSNGNRTFRGIFELQGDTYRECCRLGNNGDLPKSFTSEPGSRDIVTEWRRLGRSRAEKDESAGGIDGTWTLVSSVFAGKPMQDERNRLTMTVKLGRYTTENDFQEIRSLHFNAPKSPKWLDFECTQPPSLKGRVWPGIYELNGDTLTIDTNGVGMARPVIFGKSSNFKHEVYERVRP